MDRTAIKAELKKFGIRNEKELDAALKKSPINLGIMVKADTNESAVNRSAS